MEYELGLKELYDVAIKTTSNIEVGGKTIEAGETIAAFDKIQIANFQEIRKIQTANGGFDNRPHIWWETVKDVSLSFSQGIFSKTHFALMVNAKIYNIESGEYIKLNKRETCNPDLEGKFSVAQNPITPIFLYDSNTGNRILNFSYLGKNFTVDPSYNEVLVDYYYNYSNGYQYISIGEELTHGYFTLEGKTRLKDDITGNVKTGLIRIPKLKLVSDLSMRLGSNATPIMGTLDAVACPVGPKGNTRVMEIIFLNDDIDADI